MTETFRDYALNECPPRLKQNKLGQLLVELTGIICDAYAIAKRDAQCSNFPGNPAQPYVSDEISLKERGLVKFLNDTRASIQSRAANAWTTQPLLSGPLGIVGQLAQAGYSNPMMIAQGLLGTNSYPFPLINEGGFNYGNLFQDFSNYPPSADWWSQFIVIVPMSDYCAPWPVSFSWDETQWDTPYSNWDGVCSLLASPEQLTEIRTVINKYTPVDWVCREVALLPPAVTASWNLGLYASDPQQVLTIPGVERWSV